MPLYCTMVNSCRQIGSYLIRSYRAQGGAFAGLGRQTRSTVPPPAPKSRDAANALAGGELGLDRRNLVCRFCLSARRQSVK